MFARKLPIRSNEAAPIQLKSRIELINFPMFSFDFMSSTIYGTMIVEMVKPNILEKNKIIL